MSPQGADQLDVIVTVDAEADDQWTSRSELTVENLAFVPRFQTLCERYGLRPTYLCTFEVVEAAPFLQLLDWQDTGRAEIGAHLHPWSNPPFDGPAPAGIDPAWYPAYPSELPLESFRAKLTVLTERIAERSGRSPRSYRSGRWGLSPAHVPTLEQLGYRVDSSVTPHTDWAATRGVRGGGPDYRAAPAHPYRLGHTDLCHRGDSSVLEFPMTILEAPTIQWFRPFPKMSAAALEGVYEAAGASGLPYVMLMLHSSELMPGGSPYHPNAEAVEALYDKLARVFSRLRADGCRGLLLAEAAEIHA